MPEVDIREAIKQDLPAILALYAQPDMDGDHVLPVEQAQEIYARFKTYPDYRLYVATGGGEIIGTFALLIMDKLGHGGAPIGIVEDVVVGSEWQEKGVGSQMMRFAMARCAEVACSKLALSSNVSREAAHRFYESLGFQKYGYSFSVEFDTAQDV